MLIHLDRLPTFVRLAMWVVLTANCPMLFPQCVAQAITSTGEAQEYTVTVSANSQSKPPPVEFPDVTDFTKDYLRRMVPAKRDGKASIATASDQPVLDEAFRGDRGRDLQQRQAAEKPRVILVEDGALTLDQVVDQVDDKEIAENEKGIVTIRRPIFVKPGAVLIVDGQSTPELRLSTDRGAFLANAGRLFIVDAVVTSWNEVSSQPTVFVDKEQFRPFISSYIRSETYVAGSTIQHLGFAAPTAYGFSLSSHPERSRGQPHEDWPTGVIVGNEFRGLYYGFYSFEARDVVIVDNLYIDSVVYGIDPHDRSTRLVIARNTATGSIERHGIIGSREVSHSFIVDNVAYRNAGSGIMLDRQSAHNVVFRNKVYQNGQGIAIYESPSNTISDNLVAFNTKSGVRVRNSIDVHVRGNTIVGHDDYALELYAKKLDDHDKRVARGDTYDANVAVSFVDNRIQANRGLAKATNLGLLRLGKVERDVDVLAIARKLNVTFRNAQAAEELAFGNELKPLASKLERVLNDKSLILEVKGRVR
jgi:poly(beta-D-mannuronate) C5 epimerase